MKRTVLILALAVTACTTQEDGRFPSLLPRSIESRSDAEPEAAAPAAVAPDPALDAKLASLHADLDKAAQAFDAAVRRARPQVTAARSARAGSDPWIAAQVTLGGLDSARADTSAAVAELEQLAIERGTSGQPDYPALVAVQDAANAQLDGQSKSVAALQAMLAPG